MQTSHRSFAVDPNSMTLNSPDYLGPPSNLCFHLYRLDALPEAARDLPTGTNMLFSCNSRQSDVTKMPGVVWSGWMDGREWSIPLPTIRKAPITAW